MKNCHHVAFAEDVLDDPFDPKEFFPLEKEVAILSRICRWNGRCDRFYSVLDHSINLAFLVPKELAFEALVHDFAEAYTGDWPAPLKSMSEMAWFAEKERKLEREVWKFYAGVETVSPVVMEYDSFLARAEADAFGLGGSWTKNAKLPYPREKRNATPEDFFDYLLEFSTEAKAKGAFLAWLRKGGLRPSRVKRFFVGNPNS